MPSLARLFLLLPLAAVLHAETLRAGVARVDITPPTGLPMYGYMDRTQGATSVLDPLYARILVLSAGRERVALVTLDLGRTFGPWWLETLRDRAHSESAVSGVIVTASHTHAGPNILDDYPPAKRPAWELNALDKIAAAIDAAGTRQVPVRWGFAYGSIDIGYNRRRVTADGTVTMLWTNPTRVATAPVDPTVAVLRLDRSDGTPLAVLVNYACHPVIFGSDNLQYSADYVGAMAGTVERALGGRVTCYFLQGADGDINPYYATTALRQNAIARRDWTGETLGKEVVTVASRIRTSDEPAASLAFRADVIYADVRWPAFRDKLLRKYGPHVFEDHAEALAGTSPTALPMVVTTLLVNRSLALIGFSGEPFVAFQIAARDRAPLRDVLVAGYTNGYYDYIPTIQAASEGGYGAADSNTYVDPAAGWRMLDHALIRLHEMLGHLGDTPEDLRCGRR